MKRCRVQLLLLLIFFVFSNTVNFASVIDNKKLEAGKSSSDKSHIFYYSNYSGGSFIQARMDIPETPKVIGDCGNTYIDATIDDQGNYWVSYDLVNRLKKNGLNSSGEMSTPLAPLLGNSFSGVAYNPIDNYVYATCFYAGSWHLARVYSGAIFFDPVPLVIPGISSCMGLACTNEGVLYTYEQGAGILNLYSINCATGIPTLIAPVVLDNVGENVSLEVDRFTNKCYMSTYNQVGGRFELNEVNLVTGALTRQNQFFTYGHPAAIAFYHGVLWEPLESGYLEPNQVSRIRWNTCGNFNINVDYTYDGGLTWKPVVSNISANIDYYDWLVPNTPSYDCQLRAVRCDGPEEIYLSEDFPIEQIMPISSPNGGEVWEGNSLQTIRWSFQLFRNGAKVSEKLQPLQKQLTALSKSGAENKTILPGINVNLYYQTSETGEWIPIAYHVPYDISGPNSYLWTVPDVSSNECRVKIELTVDGYLRASEVVALSSVSLGYFTIVKSIPANGKYNITSPNGGETLQGGAAANITWRRNGIVPGTIQLQYSTNSGVSWQNINTTPIAGVLKYSWRVPGINSTRCFVRMINSITKIEYDRSNSPFTITMAAAVSNFPNPFNPSTKIVFGLENKAKVSLRVYNSLGQQVAELVNSQLEPGEHGYEFNASNLPSGVYLYDLNIDGKSQVSKMILMK